MCAHLSRSQKLSYLTTARALLDDFQENTSFSQELEHVLNTYAALTDMTRRTVGLVIGRLPLYGSDKLLNAFVGRQILIDTERVMARRADVDSEIQCSVYDTEISEDRDLDFDVTHKAKEWDAGSTIASEADIHESANDGIDPALLFQDPPPSACLRLPQPIVVLTERIVEESRAAMLPLIRRLFCRNSVQLQMDARIKRLRKFAQHLAVSDEDELQFL